MTANFHASAKVLNFIDTRPKDNEVKGAVRLDPNIQRYIGNRGNPDRLLRLESEVDKATSPSTFATFDKQDENLADFINRLSNQLGQPQNDLHAIINSSPTKDTSGEHETYGLMFDDGRRFVTEENRHLIPQGFMLILTASPLNYAATFLTQLKHIESNVGRQSRAISAQNSIFNFYITLSADIAFARALHSINGIRKLISAIEDGLFETDVGILCQILQIFFVLMEHKDIIDWKVDITSKLVEKIAVYVSGKSKLENNDSLYLSSNILLNVLTNCHNHIQTVREQLKFEALIRHLVNSDDRVLLSALTLMNSLYTKSNSEEKLAIIKILHSKVFVAEIDKVIMREVHSPNQRIREQIIQLQEIIVEELCSLLLQLPTDQQVADIMAMDEWCSSLPSSSNSADGSVHSGQIGIEDHKISDSDSFLYSQRMLQSDLENFKRIVQKAPPGCLSLCAILEYTRPCKDNRPTNIRLKEIQAESPLRLSVWPTVMAQIAISLIRVLGIHDESKCKSNRDLCRLMLKLEQPFYELFNVVMDLFSRTWREMHANVDDLQKVLSVVHDQCERAMATNPSTLEELDKLLQKKLSYFNMQKLWERERIEQEVLELNTATIQSLREYLRPSIEQLVMRRKKNFLKKGIVFTGKHSASGKLSQLAKDQQVWYWQLEENERHLCYMDCKVGGKQKELDFSSQKKVVISNIRRIIYGQEYNNRVLQRFDIKLSSKKNQPSSLLKCGLCMEINEDIRNTNILDEEYYLSTNNESELSAFLDGLQCLINPDVALQTPAMKAEIESLLNLEVRVRLLDMPQRNTASDIPIPPLPTDFSWIPTDKCF